MRHKREVFLGVIILVVATLAFLFGWTNLFTVKSVTVSGSPNSEITKQVLSIADIQKGEKLARVEPRNISAKLALAGIDWIKKVNVSRNWFSRNIDINLNAREAIAFSGDRYIDSEGILFTSPITIEKKLPEVSAANTTSRVAAIGLYLSLPPDFSEKIIKLSTSSSNNFQMTLLNGKENLRINWGSNSNNAVKVKIYKALVALPENKKINQMDVSDPTKPTVK